MMNREERRKQEKAERHAAKMQTQQEQGAQVLLQTVIQNRVDVVNRLIPELFEHDEVAGVFRLLGLGGATGVITVERLSEIANAAISAGILLPGPPPGTELDAEGNVVAVQETDEEASPDVGEALATSAHDRHHQSADAVVGGTLTDVTKEE